MGSFSGSLRSIRTCPSGVKDPLTQCLALRFSRSMATEAAMPANLTQEFNPSFLETATDPTYSLPDPTVLTTIYKFPTMEPVRFGMEDGIELALQERGVDHL